MFSPETSFLKQSFEFFFGYNSEKENKEKQKKEELISNELDSHSIS